MPISESAPVPRQWDVVVLPFPYADRMAEKRRPAVVISKPEMAERHGIHMGCDDNQRSKFGMEMRHPDPAGQ